MSELPTGTVTFLFTDIEDSTRLWDEHPEEMQRALARHDALLTGCIEESRGRVVKKTGDGFLAVFSLAEDGVGCALASMRALSVENWDPALGALQVRMALSTGTAELRSGDYHGSAVNRTSRLETAAHGGQILLSQTTRDLVQDDLPKNVTLSNLGQHWLKGFAKSEHIYQLVAQDLPTVDRPLRTESRRRRVDLPTQVTSFIGREREIADIQSLLKKARLVTLTGPGGTGKTRLSLQVAESMVGNYTDGVTFVGLASTTDPALVPNTIARELGVLEQPGKSLVESLGRYYRGKQALLALDNYEHVLEAAYLVTDLLAAAPRLDLLTTSREALRLNGEYEYLVPSLDLPDPAQSGSVADLSVTESVMLFTQRAQAASRSFQLTEENASDVAAICLRLDGLPLAIELAAARVKLFNPKQLRQRLQSRLGLLKSGARDLPARQRTLRDTIDWSYNLLDSDEQQLYSRLAVFSGGRSLEAVEAICGPGLSIDALDGLDSLLNKSLLYQEDGPAGELRFFMLETIREYAGEQLADSGEEHEIRDRHLGYFLSLAEEMEPGYRRRGQLLLLEQTEAELGNLRAAFEWAIESGKVKAAARLVSAMDYYLYYKDRYVEGYQWFNRVLEKKETIPIERQPRFLLGAGRLAWVNGELSTSRSFFRQGLNLAVELDDRNNEAWLLIYFASCSIDQPDEYEEAVKQCEQGLAMFRDLDEKPGIAQGLNILGELARASGDYSRAGQIYEECMLASQETGETYRQIMALSNLAFVATHEGDYVRAKNLLLSGIRRWREIGSWHGITTSMAFLAGSLTRLGEPEKAARLLGASDALLAQMGFDFHMSDQHEIAKYRADVRSQLDEASFKAAYAEGQAMTLEQAVAYALDE